MAKSIKTLVMTLADPSKNPRSIRLISLCKALGHHVSALGYSPLEKVDTDEFFYIPSPSRSLEAKIQRKVLNILRAITPIKSLRLYFNNKLHGVNKLAKVLLNYDFDIIIIANLQLVPLAFKIKKNAHVIWDLREFYPLEAELNMKYKILEKPFREEICSTFMSQCDALFTVSDGLKKAYMDCFGVTPIVVRSTPDFVDIPIKKTEKDTVKMVYHGNANRDRRLENLIEITKLLDNRFSLDLILVENKQYQEELRKQASLCERITFPAPVAFEEIIPTLMRYDIGFFYYEPSNFNVAHCLPNKLFEYIQARLMLAIGPSHDPKSAGRKNKNPSGLFVEQ